MVKWLVWHFKDAPKAMFFAWRDIFKFSFEFFSIAPLLKTIFKPWKRISDPYSGGIVNIVENLQAFILNSFSRLLGFLIKTVVIIAGLVFITLFFVFAVSTFLIWIILPIIIITGLFLSLALLV